MRKRVHQTSHGAFVGTTHLDNVVYPEKLGEVVVEGSLAEMAARRAVVPLRQGLAPQRFVYLGQGRPPTQPLRPLGHRARYAVVIAWVNAVLEETGAPVLDRFCQPPVSHWELVSHWKQDCTRLCKWQRRPIRQLRPYKAVAT